MDNATSDRDPPVPSDQESPASAAVRPIPPLLAALRSRIAVRIALFIVLLAVLVTVWRVWWDPRHLLQAEALLNIDDRAGAANALQKHVLSHPKDVPTQLRLGVMKRDMGDFEGGLRILRRALEREAAGRRRYFGAALTTLDIAIAEAADSLVTAGNRAEDSGDYARSLRSYARAAEVLNSHPLLRDIAVRAAVDSSDYLLRLRVTLAVMRWNKALAKKAFAEWASGDTIASQETAAQWDWELSTLGFDPDSLVRARNLMVCDDIGAVAERAFASRDWSRASQAYHHAGNRRRHHNAGEPDDRWAHFMYNAGAADYNRGALALAEDTWAQVRRERPGFAATELAGMDRSIAQRRTSQQHSAFRAAADKAFKREDWVVAAANYLEGAEFLRKRGLDSVLMAEDMYNAAMARWNARDYAGARAILLTLKEEVPTYNPRLVEEQLKEVARLLGN